MVRLNPSRVTLILTLAARGHCFSQRHARVHRKGRPGQGEDPIKTLENAGTCANAILIKVGLLRAHPDGISV
jgi:hypothetical protein